MIQYPARYNKEEKLFFAKFIDIPEAYTQGETMEDLKENAKEALSMILKDYLDDNIDIPDPSCATDANIIWVEPSSRIRQRMGHKSGCECPVCRNARGDRKRTKVSRGFNLNPLALEKLSAAAKKRKVSQNALLEEIILKAL